MPEDNTPTNENPPSTSTAPALPSSLVQDGDKYFLKTVVNGAEHRVPLDEALVRLQ